MKILSAKDFIVLISKYHERWITRRITDPYFQWSVSPGDYCWDPVQIIYSMISTDARSSNQLQWHVLNVVVGLYIQKYNGVIKWRHFPRYWPFARGILWSTVDSPNKGRRRGALIFSWSAPEQTFKQTTETPMIWDDIAPIMTSL